MGRALFVGLSAAFFIAFSLVAGALGFATPSTVDPPGITTVNAGGQEQCLGIFITICSTDFTGIPVVGPTIQALSNIQEFAYQLFAPFFQLVTFQIPGLEAASIVTLLIFGPLAFINAFIIFGAIRGSS